jgi:hypothetical protein
MEVLYFQYSLYKAIRLFFGVVKRERRADAAFYPQTAESGLGAISPETMKNFRLSFLSRIR